MRLRRERRSRSSMRANRSSWCVWGPALALAARTTAARSHPRSHCAPATVLCAGHVQRRLLHEPGPQLPFWRQGNTNSLLRSAALAARIFRFIFPALCWKNIGKNPGGDTGKKKRSRFFFSVAFFQCHTPKWNCSKTTERD